MARHLKLLAEAVPHIGHPAIRNRGTLGGSLALADPAAELPACAVALGAVVELASRRGRRHVPAAEFFQGLYRTALAPGEIVAAAEFPVPGPGACAAFLELARRRGDFALESDGRIRRRRVEQELVPFAFTGVSVAHPRLFDGSPDGAFSLNLVWSRAIAAGRAYGMRMDGVWMHVGSPDALAEAERCLGGVLRS